jgi:DNA replication and repair protein RecF
LNVLKSDYDKALKQRLRLLHDNGDEKWLSALEFEIAHNAVQIMRLRHAFLEIFTQSYDAIIADTKQGFPPFTLDIVCDSKNYPAIDLYHHKLKTMRHTDKASGRSLFGIHRSRIHVINVQKNIDIYYCSTGEQKAILSHILCVMNHLLQTKNNIVPIMLFDDALAHYDTHRIQFFYDYMHYHSDNQFFLTNTEFTTDIHTYPEINLLPLEAALMQETSLLF